MSYNNELHRFQPMVIFLIDGQRYALSAFYVKRIINSVEITMLANANDDLLGIINLHGEIIPIINLRKMLGHSNSKVEVNVEDFFIIIEHQLQTLAFISQDVYFSEIEEDQLFKLNNIINNSKSTLIEKIIKDPQGLIRILNIDEVLKNPNIKLDADFKAKTTDSKEF